MKKLFFILLLLIGNLFAYMGMDFGNQTPYSFFKASPKPGFWSEYILRDEKGNETLLKTIYVAKDKYKGKDAHFVENVIIVDKNEFRTMTIFDAKSFNILKVVFKMPQIGFLACSDLNFNANKLQKGSKDKNSTIKSLNRLDLKFIREDKFKTKSGKEIDVKVYKADNKEIWVNDKIGIVKVGDEMVLKNFGEGAKNKISIKSAKECKAMQMPIAF